MKTYDTIRGVNASYKKNQKNTSPQIIERYVHHLRNLYTYISMTSREQKKKKAEL